MHWKWHTLTDGNEKKLEFEGLFSCGTGRGKKWSGNFLNSLTMNIPIDIDHRDGFPEFLNCAGLLGRGSEIGVQTVIRPPIYASWNARNSGTSNWSKGEGNEGTKTRPRE